MANNLKESGESEMSKTSRRQKRPITIADFRNIEGSSVATSPTSINDLLPLNVPSQVRQTDQGNCLEDQPTGMSDSIGSVNIGHKRGHILTEADQGATCNTLPNPGFVETGGYSGPTTKDLTSPITRSASYQTCPNHKHTDSLIDHFCKDHLCLVCAKCAGRNHSHCKTDAIVNVCLDINVMDELKRFKRSILNFKKTMLSFKENIDTCLRNDLEMQGQKILREAREMLGPQTLENKRVLDHISVDIEWTLEKESNIITNDMELIDKLVGNFDKTYMDLELAEIKYKEKSENLFITVQNLVEELNRSVMEFQQLQNNLKLVHLSIASPGRMRKLFSNGSGIRAVKVGNVPFQDTPVQLLTFPNNPRIGEHLTRRNTHLRKISKPFSVKRK